MNSKFSNFRLPVLILIFLTVQIDFLVSYSQQSCTWTDQYGNNFDFSPLQKPQGWKVKDNNNNDSGMFVLNYIFNFCDDSKIICSGKKVGAYEALEVLGQQTDTCEILGKMSNTSYSHIQFDDVDKGVKITYQGGDICTNSEYPLDLHQPRKITFVLYCSDQTDANFQQSKINSYSVTKCSQEFTIKTPAGCRVGLIKSSNSERIVFWIIVLFVIYIILGVVYNVKVNQLNGVEAFPHFDQWREIAFLIKDGIHFSCRKILNIGKITFFQINQMKQNNNTNNFQFSNQQQTPQNYGINSGYSIV